MKRLLTNLHWNIANAGDGYHGNGWHEHSEQTLSEQVLGLNIEVSLDFGFDVFKNSLFLCI